MTLSIETKFNIKDEVFLVSNNKVVIDWVKVIYTVIEDIGEIKISYGLESGGIKTDKELFSTKAQLLKSL